jgi:hypothetical protein
MSDSATSLTAMMKFQFAWILGHDLGHEFLNLSMIHICHRKKGLEKGLWLAAILIKADF